MSCIWYDQCGGPKCAGCSDFDDGMGDIREYLYDLNMRHEEYSTEIVDFN